MKCFALLRGCELVKVTVGSFLIAIGLYMAGHTPQVLDCNNLRNSCPRVFGNLVDEIVGLPDHHVVEEAAVNAYCDCFDSCLNYMKVYRHSGDSKAPTNCFAQSEAAGVGRSAVTSDNLSLPEGNLPTVNQRSCVTCAGASEAQENTYLAIALLSAVCGVAMLATAGCEHLGVNTERVGFGSCVLIADAVAFLMLFATLFLCVWGLNAANLACDPDSMRETLEQAGRDSTSDDPNKAALYANFLFELLEPLAAGVCEQLHEFAVYAVVACLAGAASCWSCCATLCICLAISDDGLDESSDDARSLDLRALISGLRGGSSRHRRFGIKDGEESDE